MATNIKTDIISKAKAYCPYRTGHIKPHQSIGTSCSIGISTFDHVQGISVFQGVLFLLLFHAVYFFAGVAAVFYANVKTLPKDGF